MNFLNYKTLFVLYNDRNGGAEQVVKNIVNSNYYNSTVFILTQKKYGFWSNNKNVKYSFSSLKILGFIHLFFFLLYKRNWDRVFSTHIIINCFLSYFRFLRILDTKFLISRESTNFFKRFSGYKLFFYKTLYFLFYNKKYQDLIICQTDDMKNSIQDFFVSIKKDINICSINNPFVFNNRKFSRFSYNNYIVGAGRLINEKGFDLLIQSFSNLSKKYKKLKLLILGEGQERKKLEKIIIKNNLVERCLLLGNVEDVFQYFANAKTCVISSRSEGFPNILLQMISVNNNIVSTKSYGLIKDLRNVLFCDISIKSISNAIDYRLNNLKSNQNIINHNLLNNLSPEKFILKMENKLNEKKKNN